MSISRRSLLLSSVSGLALSACTPHLAQYRHTPLVDIAAAAGIGYASYAVLRGGVVEPSVILQNGALPSAEHSAHILQAASLTKPVIAYLALELALAGRIDLQAPVSTYLPKGYLHRQKPFDAPNERDTDWVPAATLARIPVATLLNHSSGLPNWTGSALAPSFEPGQRWQYSGEGYLLLQAVIEAILQVPIDVAVTQRVFHPLGMQNSRMRWTEDLRPRLVSGHHWLGGQTHFPFTAPNAAASMYTTAADYAKLMSALASHRDVLALTVAQPIMVDQTLGLEWGYGWGIEHAASGPYLWQWGNNPGYRAFAMLAPHSGDGFVLLTNSEKGLRLAAALAQTILPAEHGVFRFPMLD